MAAKKEWLLPPESELRCELGESDLFVIMLAQGNAEIFGVEMVLEKEYSFNDENIAIFTWYGCKIIEVSGSCKMSYVSSETPMVDIVNAHALLEAKRDVALANTEKGPRVMIVGPRDSGKSTTAKILASYAVRLDRNPILVDLDVSKGTMAVPGAICACALDKAYLNIKDDASSIMPLSYFYGHSSPKENAPLYQSLVSVMAAKINERLANDLDASASGIIVDTHAWSDMVDLESILHCTKAFQVDVILVTDDRLYSTLKPNLEHSSVVVAKLPRSGGVVAQDTATARRKTKAKIREYFYGSSSDVLSPTRLHLDLSDYKFWQLGGLQMHDGIRVHGSESVSASDPLQFIAASKTSESLLHSLVAVLHETGTPLVSDEASDSTAKNTVGVTAGFLYIVNVDVANDKAVVLAPCSGALPSKNIVVGTIKWYE